MHYCFLSMETVWTPVKNHELLSAILLQINTQSSCIWNIYIYNILTFKNVHLEWRHVTFVFCYFHSLFEIKNTWHEMAKNYLS